MKIPKNKTFIFLVLTIVVGIVFGNALFNKFVWDDEYLIVGNPYIKNFSFIPRLFTHDLGYSTIALPVPTAYYRPLSMLSLMVDYRFWGLNSFGYHLTNVLIHLLNSMLVFLIVGACCRDKRVSFLSSMLFAVHPIHVEAVTPILNRMGIQGAFFVLSGLYLFIKSEGLAKRGYLIGILALFFMGLLSKEDTIVLPLIFLGYDYFYLSDQRLRDLFKREKVVFYSSCFLVCALYLAIRHANIHVKMSLPYFGLDDPSRYIFAENFPLHILTVLNMVGENVARMVLPVQLCAIYVIEPIKNVFRPVVAANLLIVGIIALAAFRFKKDFRELSFFTFIFLVSMLPISNIIPIAAEYTSHDRFLYLPSLTVCFAMAVGMLALTDFLEASPFLSRSFKKISKGIPVLLIFIFAFLTVARNYTWRTDLILWQETVKTAPQSPMAHLNLGCAYRKLGRHKEAIDELNRCIILTQGRTIMRQLIYLAKINLSDIGSSSGRYNEAISYMQQAIALEEELSFPHFGSYHKLGLMYLNIGDNDKAEESFQKALKDNANFITARYNLGVLYYQRKDYKASEEQLKSALHLNPHSAPMAFALGLTYVKQGKRQDAIRMFTRILQIDPNFALARQYLSMLQEGGS